MKVKLRSQITPADINALADVYRDLQKLLVGLNPSAGCHAPLFAAIATVQACAAEWSGNGQIFREPNSITPLPKWKAEVRRTQKTPADQAGAQVRIIIEEN